MASIKSEKLLAEIIAQARTCGRKVATGAWTSTSSVCIMGAVLVNAEIDPDTGNTGAAARQLGIKTKEAWSIIHGFDAWDDLDVDSGSDNDMNWVGYAAAAALGAKAAW